MITQTKKKLEFSKSYPRSIQRRASTRDKKLEMRKSNRLETE